MVEAERGIDPVVTHALLEAAAVPADITSALAKEGTVVIAELVRLFFTLATTAIGFKIGTAWADVFPGSTVDPDVARIWGALLGGAVGYVIGGFLGRAVVRLLESAPTWFQERTGPQLFAGGFGIAVGVLVGGVVAAPFVALLPGFIAWPLAALVVLVLAAASGTVFAARADDIAGLGRRTRISPRPPRSTDRAFIVDSSAAIDGRALELARAGLISGDVWVPAFVVDELQSIADAADKDRRRRGRRGLDVLEALRTTPGLEFVVIEDTVPEHAEVDIKLVAIAQRDGAILVTTDHNLSRAASLRGIEVLNPHELGEQLRPSLAMGDQVSVTIAKAGSEIGQGVGYLDDGTMVVVADGADSIGETVDVEVSNMLRTSMGRMLFAHLAR
jgi:uncharacterized protein YacL